jgi:quercetin dioxygenase-like cupin family protein
MFAIADRNQPFRAGELYVTPVDIPVGVQAETNSIYTEIQLRKETDMNPVIKDGEVFALKELVPYQERKIVNMALVRDQKMKFVVMAFDEGTGLTEHAAPGEALIFALDGHGIIGYEGKEYPIKAGENFKFAKNGTHYIKADGRFKMALLLTLG